MSDTTTRHTPSATPVAPRRPGALSPLGLADVVLGPGFWGTLQQRNSDVVIPHEVHWVDRIGTVDNFLPPAEREVRERRGALFTDSDVYKVVEALAWDLGRAPSAEQEATLARLTGSIARAMEDDGYINTYWGAFGDRARYTDLPRGHELYCMGHLIQAGIAAQRTRGGGDPLAVLARRAADHVCDQFGEGGPLPSVDGHPEIEMALVELYRETGEERYLQTAQLIVERRGHGILGEGQFGPEYYQDDVPVREATVMSGHAVRALYLAAGAVDVAVETDDEELLRAVVRQFEATLAARTYITGGMGSRHRDEAFGDDFELPPDRSYSETCAAIATAMLAQRLLLATGDVTYGDIIERVLHNVLATSLSLEGTAFFYSNPLQRRTPSTPPPPDSESSHAATGMRAPWFSVPCCPPNASRTLATLGTYVATSSADGVQVHQYATGTVRARLGAPGTAGDAGADAETEVTLAVETGYPYAGEVVVTVERCPAQEWTLTLRVPSWAQGATVVVQDQESAAAPGALAVRRTWTEGDVVRLLLPVAPRWVHPDPRIDAVRGTVAVEAGPLVYCLEHLEGSEEPHPDRFWVDATEAPSVAAQPTVGGAPAVVVHGSEATPQPSPWPYAAGAPEEAPTGARRDATLIPYALWANRGPSTMRVWLPTS